jgi:hypothetical protein
MARPATFHLRESLPTFCHFSPIQTTTNSLSAYVAAEYISLPSPNAIDFQSWNNPKSPHLIYPSESLPPTKQCEQQSHIPSQISFQYSSSSSASEEKHIPSFLPHFLSKFVIKLVKKLAKGFALHSEMNRHYFSLCAEKLTEVVNPIRRKFSAFNTICVLHSISQR